MQTVITEICQHCKKVVGVKDGLGVSGISHVICDACVPVYCAEYAVELLALRAQRLALEART